MHNLKNPIKEPTCFKNPEKPTIIDLILTNKSKYFQHSCTYQTGIFDFHKMTITVMKVIFKKQKPKIIFHRNYNNFDKKSLKEYLKLSLGAYEPSEFALKDFQNVCFSFAPLKKKYIRANQALFMNKELKKAVMVRSKLRNKFLKSRSEEDRKAYNKQRNMSVKLLKKTKRNYFSNLNTKRVVDNKKFWKTVKSSFSDKSNNFESITLVENDSIVSNDNEVANIFNEYFSNLVEGLNLHVAENLINHYCKGEDPISSAILKYQNHPSITVIKKIHLLNKFSFENASISDIKKDLQNLDTSKATQKSDLPTKIIKENSAILVPFLFGSINSCIDLLNFPKNLKLTDITPA